MKRSDTVPRLCGDGMIGDPARSLQTARLPERVCGAEKDAGALYPRQSKGHRVPLLLEIFLNHISVRKMASIEKQSVSF